MRKRLYNQFFIMLCCFMIFTVFPGCSVEKSSQLETESEKIEPTDNATDNINTTTEKRISEPVKEVSNNESEEGTGCVATEHAATEQTQDRNEDESVKQQNEEEKVEAENSGETNPDTTPSESTEVITETKDETASIDHIIRFADQKLEAAIRDIIGKPSGNILRSDVEKISKLDISGKGISSLEGIQSFKSILELNAYDNQISELGPLEGLTQLKALFLCNNQITDISVLKGLTKLTRLSIADNSVSGISALSGMTELELLILAGNEITDISALSNMNKLKNLFIENNPISDYSSVKAIYSNLVGKDFNIDIKDSNLEEEPPKLITEGSWASFPLQDEGITYGSTTQIRFENTGGSGVVGFNESLSGSTIKNEDGTPCSIDNINEVCIEAGKKYVYIVNAYYTKSSSYSKHNLAISCPYFESDLNLVYEGVIFNSSLYFKTKVIEQK